MSKQQLGKPKPIRFTNEQESRIEEFEKRYNTNRGFLTRRALDLALDEWERAGCILLRPSKRETAVK